MEIKIEEIQRKLQEIKEKEKFDLSIEEDLIVGLMHLVSLEDHFYFTAEKTNKKEYFEMINEVRNIRKELMKKIVEKYEGEVWCVIKHLLGSSYRLIEVGTKLYSDGRKEEAKKIFDYAYYLFNLIWGLKLKMINLPEIKKEGQKEKPWTLKDIVEKLSNCCDE